MKFLKSIMPVITAGLFAAGISIALNSDVTRATLYKWSQTAASNSNSDSTINWAEGQSPSSVNDSARAMMAATAKFRDDTSGKLVTGGTSTAYTLTSNQVFSSLSVMDGAELAFRMSATSGASPTLNVDGLGAKALNQSTGVAVPTGALISGAIYRATYVNATNEWIVQAISGTVPSGTTMLSMSTACPAGWTIQTSVTADKAFRLSTTAGGVTGGVTAFTSVFNAAGGSTAITLANLPSGVNLSLASLTGSVGTSITSHARGDIATGGATSAAVGAPSGTGDTTNIDVLTSGAVSFGGSIPLGGSGTGHTHTTPNLAYVDVIGCTKN